MNLNNIESIRIGNLNYNLHIRNSLKKARVAEEGKIICGTIFKPSGLKKLRNFKPEIELLKSRSKEEQIEILWHEIAHGILCNFEERYNELFIINRNEDFINELGLLLSETFNLKNIKLKSNENIK